MPLRFVVLLGWIEWLQTSPFFCTYSSAYGSPCIYNLVSVNLFIWTCLLTFHFRFSDDRLEVTRRPLGVLSSGTIARATPATWAHTSLTPVGPIVFLLPLSLAEISALVARAPATKGTM